MKKSTELDLGDSELMDCLIDVSDLEEERKQSSPRKSQKQGKRQNVQFLPTSLADLEKEGQSDDELIFSNLEEFL